MSKILVVDDERNVLSGFEEVDWLEVRQVAELHNGTADVCNRETGGLIASLSVARNLAE